MSVNSHNLAWYGGLASGKPAFRSGFVRFIVGSAVSTAAMLLAAPYGAGPTIYIFLLLSLYFVLLYLQPPGDLLRPTELYLSLFLAYTLFGYIHFLEFNQNDFSKHTEFTFQLSSLLALLAVHLGSTIGVAAVARRARSAPNVVTKIDQKTFLVLSIGFLALIGYPARQSLHQLFSLSATQSYAEWSLSRRVDVMQNPYAAASLLWGDLAYYFILAILLVPVFTRSKYRHVFLIAATIVALLTMRAGYKNFIIFFGTAILVYLNYERKRVRYPILVACAIPAVLGVTIFNSVRNTTSLSKMVFEANDLVATNVKYVMPTRMGEFSGLVHEYMLLLDGIENNVTSISYGGTVLHDLGAFIPRFIWPDRPDPSSFLFMQRFHPAGFASGAGTGFYIVAEGYWAFGIPGVVLEGLIYGFLCAWWYGAIARPWTDPLRALVYAWALQIVVVPVVRGGFILTLKTSIMYVGPIWAILWLSRASDRLPRRAAIAPGSEAR